MPRHATPRHAMPRHATPSHATTMSHVSNQGRCGVSVQSGDARSSSWHCAVSQSTVNAQNRSANSRTILRHSSRASISMTYMLHQYPTTSVRPTRSRPTPDAPSILCICLHMCSSAYACVCACVHALVCVCIYVLSALRFRCHPCAVCAVLAVDVVCGAWRVHGLHLCFCVSVHPSVRPPARPPARPSVRLSDSIRPSVLARILHACMRACARACMRE